MVGINDLFRGYAEDRIIANYRDLLARINTLAPACQVLVHGLLPIDESMGGVPKPLSVKEIRSFNKRLKQLCKKRNITYLETFDAFDDDGDEKLDINYSWDGLHLNPKGYLVWKKLIEAQIGKDQ